jgi:hypothetical protein
MIAKVLFIRFRKNLFLSFPKKSLRSQFTVTDYKQDWDKSEKYLKDKTRQVLKPVGFEYLI